jgi:hypothetical protein
MPFRTASVSSLLSERLLPPSSLPIALSRRREVARAAGENRRFTCLKALQPASFSRP